MRNNFKKVSNHLKNTQEIMALFIKKYVNNYEESKAYGKTYGRAAMLGTVEIEELADEIQAECTATRHDILAVVSALGVAVKRKLHESKRVHIPFLGTFKLGVNTKGEEKAEDFNMRDSILNVHVIFQPETTVENGHRVKELVRGIKMKELPKYLGLDEEDDEENGGNSGGNNGGNSGGGNDDPIETQP